MPTLIDSITSELHRYKTLGEGAIEQLDDASLGAAGPGGGNSIATLVWHLAGNLDSRFTDFLTSDGEKPWRRREEEFAARAVSRAELVAKWESGWKVLLDALAELGDADLERSVTIRGQSLTVHEALHRSLAHTSYHVGQIVYLAKAFRGGDWRWLSIPPGGTAAYNAEPTLERPAARVAKRTLATKAKKKRK